MADRTSLPALRQHSNRPDASRYDAVPLPRLPQGKAAEGQVQRQDRDGARALEGVAKMGLRYLPGVNEPQGRLQHEAPPRSRRHSKDAWFMQHRLREAWNRTGDGRFAGPVEVDESYFGGRERNKHARKRLKLGRGPIGKTAVVGVKDRQTGDVKASVVSHTDGATLQSFIRQHVNPGAILYTDEALAYKGMPEFTHEAVKHSVSEFVRDMAHTNGIESFWATLKRAHKGVYHKISAKHLQRYINEFAGRHCTRDDDTRDQMTGVVAGLVGKRLMYRDLIA